MSMSLPHTGQLEAIVNGVPCHFNGDAWTTPDAALTARLNAEMEFVAKHHATIDEVANCVFRRARLEASAKILHFKCDVWPSELPDGAID